MPATLQRQSVPLPDYKQKGDTCDPASLATALILWDRENAASSDPNSNIVGVCNAALIYMTQNKPNLVSQYSAGGADGAKTFNDRLNQLTATRDRLCGTGTTPSETEYQSLSIILKDFGVSSGEILSKLGLKRLISSPNIQRSLADIFGDPGLNALKPGETAQIGWYASVRTVDSSGTSGTMSGSHAFLIGRAKAGTWFLSNQGDSPPLHLEADTLANLRTALDQAAAGGRTSLITDPSYRNAGDIEIIPQQDYSQPFRALAPPGTFLAEVDETTICCGDRLTTWDFVGTAYSDKDIDALLASSGTGHGFLVGEMPAGVFSVYKTNPVTDEANARATKIDKGDSSGGLLMKAAFIHAWLKLRTASDSSATGKGFLVY